jgi:hypothetical protein
MHLTAEHTAKELFLRVKHMDADTQDALTRFYLRLLKEETWSYQLRKENLLLKEQSQEAYRKKLNKFTKEGFLGRGKKYYAEGKPRNPFKSNLEVISSIVERYSLTKYETEAALVSFKELTKNPVWVGSLDEKLYSKERLRFVDTLFPLVFMGREISRFFFKLLFISVSRTKADLNRNGKYREVHGLLIELLNNIELDIPYDGIDYVGKRLFMDVYVKDVMLLLYAMGASEKHSDMMKVAILEDVTIPLLTPVKHANVPEKEYKRFMGLSPASRFDEIIIQIKSTKDHFVKEYYGNDWDRELASYVAYAITSSIENPKDDIKGLLRHLNSRYSVTKELVDDVATDIQRKIDKHDVKNRPLPP